MGIITKGLTRRTHLRYNLVRKGTRDRMNIDEITAWVAESFPAVDAATVAAAVADAVAAVGTDDGGWLAATIAAEEVVAR